MPIAISLFYFNSAITSVYSYPNQPDMKTLLPVVALCFIMAVISSFSLSAPENDLDKLIKRMNTELPAESGCNKALYTFNGCTLNISLACSGNEFSIDINVNDLQRVYMDKGDMEDEFQTIFFQCARGTTCIKGNGGLPDQPMFPVKLAKGQEDDLGKKMVGTFSELVGNCRN